MRDEAYRISTGPGKAPPPPGLLESHFRELHDGSGLSPESITQQGYFSARSVADLRAYAPLFSATQVALLPGLVLPVHPPDGSNGLAVLKPDRPRMRGDDPDKPQKYEWPAGHKLRVDVPVACLPTLHDPRLVRVWTEGNKKAVKGAQERVGNVLALNGIWAWKDKESPGGIAPDVAALPHRGIHQVICFDSHVMRHPRNAGAITGLRAYLASQGAVVSLAYLPDKPDGAEMKLDDFLLTHTAADFFALIGYPPEVSSSNSYLVTSSWPAPPGAAAYGGLAGDVVRLAHGCTEADPAAILTTFLVKLSAMVGRGPFAMVGATRHPMVEYGLLVGETAKARKGDSEAPVDLVLDRVDGWPKGNSKGGLSTGEGIIHDLRDGTEQDPGPEDRRRLYVETEFVRVLRASQRQGNTLSPVLRQLWDGQTLSTLTKAHPEVASEGHGAVLAHTTAKELRQEGGEAELHNGLLNRFLCPVVRRSGIISTPATPDERGAADIARRLQARLTDLRTAGPLRLDLSPGSVPVWARLYREMTRELPGAVGAALARLDAHCHRDARLYALADPLNPILGAPGSPEHPARVLVYPRHLEAAAEYGRYLRRSARYLYGDKTGDSTLDAILDSVGDGTTTPTHLIEVVFQRNVKAERIHTALALGVKMGRLRRTKGTPSASGGRPATVYERTRYEFDEETPTEAEIEEAEVEEERAADAERACTDYINRAMWRPVTGAAGLWAGPPEDLPEFCAICGAEHDSYTGTGEARCEAHREESL